MNSTLNKILGTDPFKIKFYWRYCLISVFTTLTPHIAASSEALSAEDNTLYIAGAYSDNSFIKPGIQRQGDFLVSIKGSLWTIGFRSDSATTNTFERHSEIIASCDRTNIYVVHSISDVYLKAAGAPNDVISVEAEVYPGNYPPPTFEWETHNLWIAFISSSVFVEPTGRAKAPNT